MFGLLQFSTAIASDLPPKLFLAGQLLGANAGNMVSVVNVVAAASVVGLTGQEGKVLRSVLPGMLYYLVMAALLPILIN